MATPYEDMIEGYRRLAEEAQASNEAIGRLVAEALERRSATDAGGTVTFPIMTTGTADRRRELASVEQVGRAWARELWPRT